ncbi:MAG TPA: hypothetical protein VNF69_01220 [Burkholderiales bacterium]|nr:hypothetical protein [Burkholderiales bacterium]
MPHRLRAPNRGLWNGVGGRIEAGESALAACPKGARRWQPRSWLISSAEVVSNMRHYGPEVLAGTAPRRHHFEYRHGEILRYRAGDKTGRERVAARAASRVRCAPTWLRRPPRGRGLA